MKVRELRERLAELPDELEVFTQDYEYGTVRAENVTLVGAENRWVEIRYTGEVLFWDVDHTGAPL